MDFELVYKLSQASCLRSLGISLGREGLSSAGKTIKNEDTLY